jgi:hypothetical protein
MLSLSIAVMVFSACTLAPIHEPAPVAGAFPESKPSENLQKSWWACRFQIHWPADEPPDFTVDLLLAHAVVGPVLKAHARDIDWWRFHRRAARDPAGHRFSFLFYTEPAVAAEIFAAISGSRMLQETLDAGWVVSIDTDDPSKSHQRDIEALSDPNWSPAMQRNWPYFIMGVSSLWLALIDDLMGSESDADTEMDLTARMEAYRAAASELNALWYEEGQHALLHHLNAIFGYQPIRIRKNLRF